MGAVIRCIRFPLHRVASILIVRERGGDGWLAFAGSHGWLFGSRREAIAEAQWLARNLALPGSWCDGRP
jgi:hypothetical protein